MLSLSLTKKLYLSILLSMTDKTEEKSSLTLVLKTMDTSGNCQRTVFSLRVSQHMHKITNLWKFEL